jgi:hypothetical protein
LIRVSVKQPLLPSEYDPGLARSGFRLDRPEADCRNIRYTTAFHAVTARPEGRFCTS